MEKTEVEIIRCKTAAPGLMLLWLEFAGLFVALPLALRIWRQPNYLVSAAFCDYGAGRRVAGARG